MKSAHAGNAVEHALKIADKTPRRAFCERHSYYNSPLFSVSPCHNWAVVPSDNSDHVIRIVYSDARNKQARHNFGLCQRNVVVGPRRGTATHFMAPFAFHAHGDAIPALGSRKVTFSGGVS